MTDVFVVPREGVLVRHPDSKQPVAADGELVSLAGALGRYWRRRIGCGDLIIKSQKQSKAKKEA